MINRLASISLLLEKRSNVLKRLVDANSKLIENNKDFYDDYIQALDNLVRRIDEFIEADVELKASGETALIENMLNIITLMSRDYSIMQQELVSRKKSTGDIMKSYEQVKLILRDCIQFLYSLVNEKHDELSIVTLEELNKILFILALDL